MSDLVPGLQLPNIQDGNLKVSQSYVVTPEAATWKRRKFTVTAGQVNFFDIEITTEKRIRAGTYVIKTAYTLVHPDDYLEFSIIDKNDILGLFSLYGLIVGQDILELHKFVRTEYIDANRTGSFDAWCSTDLVQGLFLRIAYNSFGTTNIELMIRILFHE